MKSLVAKVEDLSHGRTLILGALSFLPSGWTALTALAHGKLRRYPSASLRYAERAVQANPSVWQGHAVRVEALEALGRTAESNRAKLFGLVATSQKSFERIAMSWFGVGHRLDRPEMLRQCAVPVRELSSLMSEIVRVLDPDRAVRATESLAQAYGSSTLASIGNIHDVFPEPLAIALASSMRREGAVASPIALLERYEPTQSVDKILASARQDASVLKGRLELHFREPKVVSPIPKTSLYLLHNSLPQKSGGYATRSHGIITAARGTGWNMIPVTRPGFPSQKYVFDQDPHTLQVEVVDGVPYHRLLGPVDSQPRSDLQGFLELYVDYLAPLIEGYRPEVVHAASNWWNGFAAVAAAREFGIPSVYEIRGLWEVTRSSRVPGWERTERYDADARYEAEAARLADRVIVITKGLKDEMVQRGIDEDKIVVVPNAVDVRKLRDRPFDEELAQQLGIDDEVVIGFAGSLTFYEGLDDLLRAGQMIRGRTTKPFRFLFVGDGPVLADLQELASELGLEDLCAFVGQVPHSEVARYLSLVSITPFPRKPLPVSEMVSPLKPLESMATRSVVLASDVGALEEMVPPGTGLTFAKGDVEDLAFKLERLVDDDVMRRRLANDAFQWVSHYRSWPFVVQGLDQIYRELSCS